MIDEMDKKAEKLIESAGDAKEGFRRDLKCSVYPNEKGAVTVSRLTDMYHELTLALEIDSSDFTISETGVKMDRVPYPVCKETAREIENLKGLPIFHPTVNREVRRRIKRHDGCTHLFELIEFTLQTLFSGGSAAGLNGGQAVQTEQELHPEEHRQLQISNPRLKNTCRAFKSES